MSDNLKYCTACKQHHDRSQFNKKINGRFGLTSTCKDACKRKYQENSESYKKYWVNKKNRQKLAKEVVEKVTEEIPVNDIV